MALSKQDEPEIPERKAFGMTKNERIRLWFGCTLQFLNISLNNFITQKYGWKVSVCVAGPAFLIGWACCLFLTREKSIGSKK
ncbi:hypothetical protein [Pseudomonas zeae]|uniref:hypothetical protein n=1 Tax=Pseudomonas zeae TaxID=2745510 RepID=UPI0039E077BB